MAADYELQRWLEELKSPDGGGINGLPSSVTTKETLYLLVTEVIFRASGGHAAARNAQYDNLASLLNAPGKLLTDFPAGREEIDYPQALPGLVDSRLQEIAVVPVTRDPCRLQWCDRFEPVDLDISVPVPLLEDTRPTAVPGAPMRSPSTCRITCPNNVWISARFAYSVAFSRFCLRS